MYFFPDQVQDYLTRLESIPDIIELDHLTVSGDVTFGKHVVLKVGEDSYLASALYRVSADVKHGPNYIKHTD